MKYASPSWTGNQSSHSLSSYIYIYIYIYCYKTSEQLLLRYGYRDASEGARASAASLLLLYCCITAALRVSRRKRGGQSFGSLFTTA